MSRTERIIIGAIGLSLALSLIFVGSRWVSVKIETGLGRDNPNSVSLMRSPSGTKLPTNDQPTSVPTEAPEASDLSPIQIPISEGAVSGEDIEDVLLLYSGSAWTIFDQNFCKIANFYGLLCKQVDLHLVPLTDDVFKDNQGEYFKLIAIQAEHLLLSRFLVSSPERDVLKKVIEEGGSTLLVSELKEENFPIALVTLTDGAIQGVVKPVDKLKDWIISGSAPEITKEFTGQVITRNSEFGPHDYAIVFGDQVSAFRIMSAKDDSGSEYTFFAFLEMGDGSIFLDASQEGSIIGDYSFNALLYDIEWFTKLVPSMMTLRYVFGDEAWHNDHNYANLTIDDLPLVKDIPSFDYVALLREMEAHDFHTTIGFIPAYWEKSEAEVASLFRTNPTYFSIAQHGNNDDGYEFYKYDLLPSDWIAGDPEPARPLSEQEADIVEGLRRLDQLWARFSLSYDKVMIFPGIPPELTLELLKKHNYLATVNGVVVPLDEDRPDDWDFGMYPANLDFGNFPMLSRRYLEGLEAYQEKLNLFMMDFFIDKPALMYSSAGKLFNGEMDAFSAFADEVNGLEGDVEWQSLGSIIRYLYLEKVNDDGSVDVKMYANNLILGNDTGHDLDYHFFKEDTLNIPIAFVTVNGHEFPYLVWDGVLQMDLKIPAGEIVEILIYYEGLDLAAEIEN